MILKPFDTDLMFLVRIWSVSIQYASYLQIFHTACLFFGFPRNLFFDLMLYAGFVHLLPIVLCLPPLFHLLSAWLNQIFHPVFPADLILLQLFCLSGTFCCLLSVRFLIIMNLYSLCFLNKHSVDLYPSLFSQNPSNRTFVFSLQNPFAYLDNCLCVSLFRVTFYCQHVAFYCWCFRYPGI